MKTEIIPGLASLAARYDAFIVDLWGTLHNGVEPLPGALEALRRLKALNKSVALLSNAPFRIDAVVQLIGKIGVPHELYDCLLSSGEVAWHALAQRRDPWHARLGRRAAFIGPDRHRAMLDNPGIDSVVELSEADFILCTGPRQATDTVADYRDELAFAAASGLPMICSNPDREVIRGEVREICAGAIAACYEVDFGGDVAWHGKPFAAVFDEVLALLGGVERSRVLVIGDGMYTDIAGAAGAHIDAAFVCGGIHAEALGIEPGELPDRETLERFLAGHGQAPCFAVARLRWD